MTQEELAELRNELKTQDNRITANPLFIVEVERRIYGMDEDWTNDYIWVYSEDSEYTYEPDEIIESIRDECEDGGLGGIEKGTLNLYDKEIDPEDFGYERCYYVTVMDFVSAHFTEKAANRYIAANRHNLRQPRTYVTSQYRCHEWNMVRDFLMAGPTLAEAVDAIDLTRQYVGEQLLPCIKGWSWWDFVISVLGEEAARERFNDRLRERMAEPSTAVTRADLWGVDLQKRIEELEAENKRLSALVG